MIHMRALCLAGVIALTSQFAHSQEVVLRARLNVLVSQIEVVYSDQEILGQAIVLNGEPLDVDIGIFNPYTGPKAGAEADWIDRAILTLSSGTRFDAVRKPIPSFRCIDRPNLLRTEDAVDDGRGGRVVLEEGGAQYYRCQVDAARLGLRAGPYTLTAQWNERVLSSEFQREHQNRQPAILQFELRDVRTEADRLDLGIHLAIRAFSRGDAQEAVRLADALLLQAPSSIGALIIRGRASAGMGKCREARADWIRAAEALEGNLDVANRANANRSPEERRREGREWREQARRLPCN